MTKLLDTSTGELVEIPASDVLAARKSGRFGFSLDRPVPIIQNGEPKWIPAKLADQYRSSLTFTDDDTVFEYNAKERMSGIGGVLAGGAYGAAKGLTLGLSPLVMKAAGYGDLARDIELGAGNSALAAEVASLGFNPLAAFGRGGGKAVAKGAGLAAEHAAAAAAPAAAKGAGLAVEKGAERVIAKEPLLLGEGAIPRRPGPGPGPLPSGEVDTRIGQGLRAQSRELPGDGVIKGLLDVGGEGAGPPHLGGVLALPEKGVIRLEEMPSTLTGPPLESRLMTDLRNEQANLADRMIGLDKVISTEEKSRSKGSGAVLKILRGERDDVASRIEEYDFQLMKYERPEEMALAEQAGRAEERAARGRYQTSFPDVHVLPGARRDILAEQRVAADAVMSARETKATEDARAAVMREGLPAEYTGRRPTAGGRTELATTARRPGFAEVMAAEDALGREAKSLAEWNARNTETAAAEVAAWRAAGDTRVATQEELAAVAAWDEAARWRQLYNEAGGAGAAPPAQFGSSLPPGAVRMTREGTQMGREVAAAEGRRVLGQPRQGVAAQVEREVAAAEGVAPGPELEVVPGGPMALGTQLPPVGAGLPLPPAGLPSGVAGSLGQAASGTGSSLLRTATEGAIYGGASQASREQLGLEEGSPGSVMKAALLGGGLSGAIHLGLNAASRGSLSLGGVGTGGAIGRGLKSLEDTHIMRGLGNTAADVKSMNIRLKNTASGEVGSHFYVDEVKNAFANIADLQRQFPDDVLLQSIPLDGKWSSMTAERKMAFTDAFKASLGPRYDSALSHINGVGVDDTIVEAIVEAAKSKAAKGLEKTSLGSVNKVLNDIESGLKKATKPFRDAADAAEAALPDTAPAQLRAQVRDEAYAAAKEAAPPSYTIKDINKIKTELGKDFDDWSSKHGGEWTPVQMGVYNDFKGVVYDEAATFSANNGIPIHAQLTELDKLFMVAATMSKGVANDAAKKALQSPVGRDLLSQFALGAFAIGNPIGAALFAVGSAGLRGIYNSRGEGFIADMAAKLSRGVVANPQAAAAVAAQSIYSARRPVVLGYNAERLVDSEPKDYSAIVKSVRELNESRESVIADIRSKTSGLSPQEQTAAVDGLDKMMNDLAMNVPPGLSVPGQLSQQQKNYVVYAKSMLSPAYAVQVLVNGGTGGAAAAKALSDLGANGEGKLFLDTLANELKKHVDESDDRKTAESAAAAYASIAKMVKSTTVARIHSKSGLAMPRPKLMPGPKAPVIKAGSANRFVAGAVTVK